jgi:hypothetical protein
MVPERPATEGPKFACFSRLLTQDFIVFRNLQAAQLGAGEISAIFDGPRRPRMTRFWTAGGGMAIQSKVSPGDL